LSQERSIRAFHFFIIILRRHIVSVAQYRDRITEALNRIWDTQTANIEKVSAVMADCIVRGGLVHLFGSGIPSCLCRTCFRVTARSRGFGP
jgi:uncharacterized phosphosugar-binding protein